MPFLQQCTGCCSNRPVCARLTMQLLGMMSLQVYGIVTRCSLVRPKLVKSVHYCTNTGVTTSREYRDITALTGLPTGASQAPALLPLLWQRKGQQPAKQQH